MNERSDRELEAFECPSRGDLSPGFEMSAGTELLVMTALLNMHCLVVELELGV